LVPDLPVWRTYRARGRGGGGERGHRVCGGRRKRFAGVAWRKVREKGSRSRREPRRWWPLVAHGALGVAGRERARAVCGEVRIRPRRATASRYALWPPLPRHLAIDMPKTA
jgi:hypothetical protein